MQTSYVNDPPDGAPARRDLHHPRAAHPGHVPLLPLLLLHGPQDPQAHQGLAHAGSICLQGKMQCQENLSLALTSKGTLDAGYQFVDQFRGLMTSALE